MKRKLKMIGIILGVMILTSIASVYAVQAVNSIDVSYDNTTSGLTSTNVKGAIDSLYSICTNTKTSTEAIKKILLAKGYTQLEYLDSNSGGPYIDM